MPIRELRTFLAVAEYGSFAAAARAVGRTQSAVTVQMRALEEEFGIALFDRSRRPPVLSPAGQAFRPHAAGAVAAYDRLYGAGVDTSVEGHLRLGVIPSVITGVMPRALVALRARYPALHVELAMGLSQDLVERVREGALDAAVVSDFRPAGRGIRWSPVAREPLILIAPPDATARRAEEALAAHPFIRYARQAWVGQLIDTFLKRRHLSVREVMVLDTLEAIRAMVHHGLGVSIVPQRARDEAGALAVRVLHFSGPVARRVVGVVRMDGQGGGARAKDALVEVLLAALRHEVEAAGG